MAAISPSVYSGPYTANGSQTAFPFDFSVMDASGVAVTLNGVGVTAGYTVTFGATSGTVHFGAPPNAGAIVLLQSNPDFTQTSEFENESSYKLTTVNKINRRSSMRDLFLRGQLKRSVVAPVGVDVATYVKALLGPAYKGDPGGNVMSVGSFAALPSLLIPVGTDRIRTSSGADYIYDAAVDTAYVALYPRAAAISANGRGFRLAPSQTITPQMFGAAADNATDDLPAFNAAYAYLKKLAVQQGFYAGGPALLIPAGTYYLSGTWEIKGLTCIIEGEGTGQAGGNATTLRFPANTCGIRVHRYNTIGATVEGAPTQGADGTFIRNLALQGSRPGLPGSEDYSGIWARCRVTIRDVAVDGFAGAGILIRATQGGGGAFEGNANNWRVDTVRLTNNCAGGFVLRGADANAGISHGVDASNNIGYGIDDFSFLGNGHWGFQMEANSLGPWRTTGPNGKCWMDGYTEPGQPNAVASAQTIWSGQQFVDVTGGAGLTGAGLDGGGLASSSGFYARRVKTDGTVLRQIVGCDPANNEFTQYFTQTGGEFGITDSAGDLGFSAAVLFEGFRIKSGITTEKFGRPTSASVRGGVHFPRGAWFGAGTNSRCITYVNATNLAQALSALAGVEVANGDRFYFSGVSPGGFEGVVVTTGGIVASTAVLKTFGAISA